MTLGDLIQDIAKRHENKESYSAIGEIYNLNPGIIWKLVRGLKVSKKTLAHLNLDPSPKLKATQERREKLNAIARSIQYPNWSAYETACIKDYESKGIL